MKKLVIIIAMTIAALYACADSSYRIVKMSSPKIYYKGKECHINDTIKDLNLVRWGSENDAMQLDDLSKHQYMEWTARKHKQKAMDSNGIIVSGQLSSRGPIGLAELIAELSDVVLFDEWHCYTEYPTTDVRWFELTYETTDGTVSRKLNGTADGEIIITRDMFDGVDTDRVSGVVKYVFADGKEILVSDTVAINLMESIE